MPQSCGNGPYISYPFWIFQEQDSFRGYPNFEITCKNNSPVLIISDDNYFIKDIWYSNNTFVVVNVVVYEEMCPIPLQNATFDRTPFNAASNTSSYSSAVFHEEGLESSNYYLGSCQSFVNAPVYMDMDTSSNFTSLLKANYSEILRMGFLLNWTAHSCSNCESSGGRCGVVMISSFVFARIGLIPKRAMMVIP
ncbi:hypothetical protein SLEP1_g47222 [Rubroshorea leprosula]|uniref:non-specific serine/threonine protein kinase n=1 Tax=Rubroshorea leprosula TaxID=152421 RepID=A0AAV5LQQ1_9ROSI|nr:hypothetical protein SLEP1_g47222 [Rubroshorea leprosula]